MEVFIEGPHGRAVDYVRRMGDLYDPTYIALLIELHTTQLMGARVEPPSEHIPPVLSRLTRQTFSYPWDWIEWYASTDHQPPAGFIGWKGEIFSQFDPRFADLLAPDRASRIRAELLVWNGVGPEGIPPLNEPPTVKALEATFLTDEDPVVGLSVSGAQRAYPLRVLDWHEMVNDELSGLPVAATYCVLCGTAIVYDARATDGLRYTFGNAGLVLNSNTLVFDHQTETLWLRMTGDPVLGPLVETNTRL